MSNIILNKEGLESFKKFSLNENNNININNSNNISNSNAPGYQITEKGTPRLKKKKITRKKSKKAFTTRKRKTLNRSFRIMGKFDGNSINNNEPNKNINVNSPKLKFYNKLSKRVGFAKKMTKAMSELYSYNFFLIVFHFCFY